MPLNTTESNNHLPHFPALGLAEKPHYCIEKTRLQEEILNATRELTSVLSQQTQAVIDGDPDFSRFDLPLKCAQQRKDFAKIAWISHVTSHDCE